MRFLKSGNFWSKPRKQVECCQADKDGEGKQAEESWDMVFLRTGKCVMSISNGRREKRANQG